MVVPRQSLALRTRLLVILEEFVEAVAGPLQRTRFLVAAVASLLHKQNSELDVPATAVPASNYPLLAATCRFVARFPRGHSV